MLFRSKFFAQRLPGTIEAGFDGFLGTTHDPGDLGMAEIVVLGKDNRGALVFRQ